MNVPLYNNRIERTKSKNYRGISLLSMVEKTYVGILVNRECRVTEGLIDMSKVVSDQGGGV